MHSTPSYRFAVGLAMFPIASDASQYELSGRSSSFLSAINLKRRNDKIMEVFGDIEKSDHLTNTSNNSTWYNSIMFLA